MSLGSISRREVLAVAAAAPLTLGVFSPQDRERPAAVDAEQVKKFVIAAHRSLDEVKEMLKENPNLLNATWDWGGGDFESALGGAGHMGNREIAEHLIGQGARSDIFVHAMLGDLDVVRPMIKRFPNLVDAKGPHGISLLRHAQKGGDQAKGVLEFLESL
jgi:hypothetical protein